MSAAALDLGHTPGLYYALAYWLSLTVFLAATKRRHPRGRSAAASALFLAVLSGFMVLTDGVDSWLFVLCVLGIFGLQFLAFRYLSVFSWRSALYYTVRIFILGEFAASFEWQMFYFGLTGWGLPLNILTNVLFLAVVHSVVFGIAYGMERRYREQSLELELTGRELAVVCLLGVFIFTLSNLSFASPSTPFSGRSALEIFAIRTLADLGGVGLLFAYHIQLCEMSARMEKEYLRKLLHMQKEAYRVSSESVELINRKYHDLKHHIQLLRSELGSEEKLRYLDEVEQDIRSYEAQNKTGNKVLDTMLTSKSLVCQKLGITVTCVADGKELDFMKPTDLSVLIGNALDNAVESVRKIEDPEKRLIHISVARQKSFVRIRVENCCEEEVRFSDGLPATRKDARYHGYGMKSIRSIVEKYEGSMTVKVQDGWFELRVLFPRGETDSKTEGRKIV